MKLILISIFVLLGSIAQAEDYVSNFIGSCDVKGSQRTANFYVRTPDNNFRFEFIDESGEIAADTSAQHRQNIFTEKHGIKLKPRHITIRATDSFYKAKFRYYHNKGTAYFKHKNSCMREWILDPCGVYTEKYKVKFENCSLDFSNYID